MTKQKKGRNIGNQLKQAIHDQGVKVTDFAEAIGVSRSMVYDYLNNRRNPSVKTLKLISDYFGLPVEYFTGDMFDSEGNLVKSNREFSDYNDQQLQVSKDNLVQTLNDIYESLSYEDKVSFLLQLGEFLNLMKHEQKVIDLKLYNYEDFYSIVHDINSMLGDFQISNVDAKSLKHGIETSRYSHAFNVNDKEVYESGIETGIMSVLCSETIGRRFQVLYELKKYGEHRLNDFPNDILRRVINLFHLLVDESLYVQACNEVVFLLRWVTGSIEVTGKLGGVTVESYIHNLAEMDDRFFNACSGLVYDLINVDNDSFYRHLVDLQSLLIIRMSQIKSFAKKYGEYDGID